MGLFDDLGYDLVTTDQIATKAGVTQRTFFRHFATKVDVLTDGVQERQEKFIERLFQQPSELTIPDALIKAIGEDEKEYPWTPNDARVVRVFRASDSLGGTLRTYEILLDQQFGAWIAQRSGRDASDFGVRVAAATLVAARRVVVEEWHRGGGTSTVKDVAKQALGTFELHLD